MWNVEGRSPYESRRGVGHSLARVILQMHESFMIKRNIRVTKWMGMLPVVAVCTACGREFKASLNELRRATAAQESLQRQFDQHMCEEPKPQT